MPLCSILLTSLDRLLFEWNMSTVAALGAASLKLMAKTEPLVCRTTMNPPPPIPEDSGWTAPTQSSAVMAASTAEPPLLRMSADRSEQMGTSVATPPAQYIAQW